MLIKADSALIRVLATQFVDGAKDQSANLLKDRPSQEVFSYIMLGSVCAVVNMAKMFGVSKDDLHRMTDMFWDTVPATTTEETETKHEKLAN